MPWNSQSLCFQVWFLLCVASLPYQIGAVPEQLVRKMLKQHIQAAEPPDLVQKDDTMVLARAQDDDGGTNLLQATSTPPGPNTYVFVAGLEGTGHHFLTDVFRQCDREGGCATRLWDFHHSIWVDRFNISKLREAWSKPPILSKCCGEHFKMQRADLPPGKKVPIFVNILSDGWTGEMSYPNLVPGFNIPQLQNYYRVATEMGDSFKVLVLLRDPQDLLFSANGRWLRREEDLLKAQNEMAAQLKQIPKQAIRCVSYDDLPKAGEALQDFLGIDSWDLPGAFKREFKHMPGCQQKGKCPSVTALKKAQEEMISSVCGNNALS